MGREQGVGAAGGQWRIKKLLAKMQLGKRPRIAVKEEVGGEFTTLQRGKGSGKCTLV